MARNKHPEETVQKILDVSARLFTEKGYDNTTIQDIIDALGMSKGAIYHHFNSKEEILDRINDRYYEELEWYPDPSRVPGGTGLEKLKYIFHFFLSDPHKRELDGLTVSLMKNPRLVALTLESTLRDAAPYMERLVYEAIADGSARVEYPRELSEAFMLLINVWTAMFAGTRSEFEGKLRFCRDLLDHFGLPLLDDELVGVALNYYDQVLNAK